MPQEPVTTSVLLIRHGPTHWNAHGRIQGQTDVPLTSAARAELGRRAIPAEFTGFCLVASPLQRAMETARLLCGEDPAPEPRLAEMSWGEWEGETLRDLRRRHGSRMVEDEMRGLDFNPPGGESPRQVQKRLQAWLDEVARAGRPVLGVTHKGVIRAALALATGWDMRGKPPVRLDWSRAHLFGIRGDGRLVTVRLNIALAMRVA